MTNAVATAAPASTRPTLVFTYTVQDLAWVTTSPLPNATVGTLYSTTLQTSGGSGAPTFAVTGGTLPPGLNLDPATGVISGTPTTTGTYDFTVEATDPDPNVTPITRDFQITVGAAPALTCATATPTIVGNNLPNVLIGTPGDDVIFGLGGSDVIDGRGGNDLLCGGTGNDKISGGDGNDRIEGGDGADVLTGGNGNDALFGGNGLDVLDGGPGINTNNGGAGLNVCVRPLTGPGCTI
ncbi:putative Ig domain-containing protein [Streptomyces sp. NPDC005805]|uniref:calcium-binding protein n=1 Tax=Streptomyces sp. NPDC005805 TaxID=3157068 RepID=UPI00340EE505